MSNHPGRFKPGWSKDRHFLCKRTILPQSLVSCLPSLLVEVRGRQTTLKEITFKERNDHSLMSSRENLVGQCVALCVHYRLLNCKPNIIRKQVIFHIFLHTLGKTYICGCHQGSTETTSEIIIGNQYLWAAQWLMRWCQECYNQHFKMVQENCRSKKINIISIGTDPKDSWHYKK